MLTSVLKKSCLAILAFLFLKFQLWAFRLLTSWNKFLIRFSLWCRLIWQPLVRWEKLFRIKIHVEQNVTTSFFHCPHRGASALVRSSQIVSKAFPSHRSLVHICQLVRAGHEIRLVRSKKKDHTHRAAQLSMARWESRIGAQLTCWLCSHTHSWRAAEKDVLFFEKSHQSFMLDESNPRDNSLILISSPLIDDLASTKSALLFHCQTVVLERLEGLSQGLVATKEAYLLQHLLSLTSIVLRIVRYSYIHDRNSDSFLESSLTHSWCPYSLVTHARSTYWKVVLRNISRLFDFQKSSTTGLH